MSGTIATSRISQLFDGPPAWLWHSLNVIEESEKKQILWSYLGLLLAAQIGCFWHDLQIDKTAISLHDFATRVSNCCVIAALLPAAGKISIVRITVKSQASGREIDWQKGISANQKLEFSLFWKKG